MRGGFVCTSEDCIYNILVALRSHGWARDIHYSKAEQLKINYGIDSFEQLYTFYYPGLNLRATDFQAFLGIRQILKIQQFSESRNNNFFKFNNFFNLSISELKLKQRNDDFISNFSFPIVSENRKDIVKRLMENNIEVRPLIAGSMRFTAILG